MQYCHLQHNVGEVCGGAAHLEGATHLEAEGCTFTGNVCKGAGGGICASEGAALRLQGCTFAGNIADRGGAIQLGDDAAMGLQSTRIENNSALSYGGGLFFASSNFSLSELHATVRNNKALHGNDVDVPPRTITTTMGRTVEGFVSRLGTNAGLLEVTLRTSGVQGLPSEYATVHGMLDDLVVAVANSGPGGFVSMHIKIHKPPGRYYLVVSLRGLHAFAANDAIVPCQQ